MDKEINLNIGDKILDLEMSRLNKCDVYAEVIVIKGDKVKCRQIDRKHERHYPHNFYDFEENTKWIRA
tara:strand:+ start:967 stop:1170 length:204 start_codon:yes stop_codon:yes gene_type:complete